ncbi:MAG: hypothetical protein QGG75_06785 [Alphaproteobacteria bacterium]|jgi:hypothetical protein|nr:hypothetical protein [Alphaproteobacteria bacterium]
MAISGMANTPQNDEGTSKGTHNGSPQPGYLPPPMQNIGAQSAPAKSFHKILTTLVDGDNTPGLARRWKFPDISRNKLRVP